MSESFDFDREIDRRGTDSEKWHRYAVDDVLPLWVADMDFRSSPEVLNALRARVEHGVFGYGYPTQNLIDTMCAYLERNFSWQVDPAWLVWLPGLVSGLSVCCRAVGNSGDGVGVLTPVYPPFLKVPSLVDRTLETAPLAGDNRTGWRLDPQHFVRGFSARMRLLLLCHPHNPVGRVWTAAELRALADYCLERRIVMCSDEIHNRLILEPGVKHIPLATLGPEVAARTITLLAPSKTYNIAGLGCSVAVISDPDLRRRFKKAAAGIVPHPNVLGMVAAEAAMAHGQPWLEALLSYLQGNRDYLAGRLAAIPGVTMAKVEGTYLAWLDVQELGLKSPAAHFLAHGLSLSAGRDFGADGYVRLNFGCRRALLQQACDRLEAAVRVG